MKRPFVFLNVAVTADGKIASEEHHVTTFGSPADSHHLYELRSTADAILCGARTLEATRATLGNGSEAFRRRRLRRGLAEHPLRIVVSGSGSISSDAAIWSQRFSPILLLTTERSRREWKRLEGLADEVWCLGRSMIDFGKALECLHREHGVRRLLCEGGGELNEALIRAGLVDELHITLVAVDPGRRRQGLGRLVLQGLIAAGQQRGARYATLEVSSANGPARALYGAAGFEEAGLRRGYYRNGEDALIQWLRLNG